MPTLKALWKPLSGLNELQRSSHALAVHGGKGFLFGGELKPRTPVDATVTELNLETNSFSRALSPPSPASAAPTSPWPIPRVGHTFVSGGNGKLYLWGGRGGKDMSTVSGEASIWAFEPVKGEWEELQTKGEMQGEWEELQTKGEMPEARSFHTIAALDGTLYLHAGCPASGRLSTLHSLDLTTLTWTSLPSAPSPGRGGTVLTSLPSSTSTSSLLARFGGFAGYELGGLDIFDVEKGEWSTPEVGVEGGGDGPGKRSVHALIGLSGEVEWEGKRVVAVLAMGEREGAPKELGHDGAGFFHSDAWALLSTPTTSASPSLSWLRLEPSSASEGTPEARGWFASAYASGNKIVLQGGLNAKNERLEDGWTLEVVLE
ncbi:hypothetical protein JCM10213_006455 [Rhodosporidiobolus nylandii]